MIWAFIILCALSVSVLLWAEASHYLRLKSVAKLTASASFVGAALWSGALESNFGLWIFAGLVLSFLGDAFLLSQKRSLFLGGMAAFGAVHLAYIGGFIVASWPWNEGRPVGAGALAILCVFALRWLLPQLLPQWRGPTLVYGIIIGAMTTIAAIAVSNGNLPSVFLLAAVMFAVSDISVARDRLTASDGRSYIWGLPLYFAAQMLFAISFS